MAESTALVKTIEERKALLAQQIALVVVRDSARVESQTDTMAVLVRGRRVNHILHFLLGFPTLGIWWLTVWPFLVLTGGEKRSVVQVDEYGNVVTTKQ